VRSRKVNRISERDIILQNVTQQMGDEIVPIISKPSKTNIMMAKHGRSSNNNTMAINLNSSQPHAMNIAATTTNTTRSLSKNTS